MTTLIIVIKGVAVSQIQILVSFVGNCWKKLMLRERNLSQSGCTTGDSATTSGIAMVEPTRDSMRSCSTISPNGEKLDKWKDHSTGEGKAIAKNNTKRSDIWLFDVQDQSDYVSESLESIRSMVDDFGESITRQLMKMSKRMDELQKTTDDEKKNFGVKFESINQQFRQVNKRLDEVQKTK